MRLALAFVLFAAPVHAESRTSSLSWVRLDGADECIPAQSLAQSVETRVGHSVFVSTAEADLSIEGRIELRAGVWRAQITLRDRDGKVLGTREITSREKACSAINDALALAIAVMLDPDPDAPAPQPDPPPPVTREVVVVKRETVLVPVTQTAPPRWQVQPLVGVGIAAGLQPNVTMGVDVGFIVEPPRFWAFAASIQYWLEDRQTLPVGASVNYMTTLGSLALCPLRLHPKWSDLYVCAGAAVGLTRYQGVGFPHPYASDSPLVNGLVRGGIAIHLIGPLVAGVDAAIQVPFYRDLIVYTDVNLVVHEIFQIAPVVFIGAVTVGFHFR